MTLYSIIFYLLALVITVSTVIAITRRNMVHAVIYLVVSFFGSAMLFYLLGAPLLAMLEVIIYAGAIMILFLFIIMMLKVDASSEIMFPRRQMAPAMGICGLYVVILAALMLSRPEDQLPLEAASVSPGLFGQFLFRQHWLSIEIVSLLLLVAVIGVLFLGKDIQQRLAHRGKEVNS